MLPLNISESVSSPAPLALRSVCNQLRKISTIEQSRDTLNESTSVADISCNRSVMFARIDRSSDERNERHRAAFVQFILLRMRE